MRYFETMKSEKISSKEIDYFPKNIKNKEEGKLNVKT